MSIIKNGGGLVKVGPKEDLQAIADEINATADIFGLGGDEIRHLKKAFFYANIGNGLVPDAFKGDYRSIFIMSQLAESMNCELIRVMQGGYFVHGRWGWYAEFMINRALELNIFSTIHYETGGTDEASLWTRAIGTRPDGTQVIGTNITMAMAKGEGWTKNSKYQTMPAYMLKKRAATFLIRETAAHIFASSTMTSDELEDMKAAQAKPVSQPSELATTPQAITEAVANDTAEAQRLEVLAKLEAKISALKEALGGGGDAIIAIEGKLGMAEHQVKTLKTPQLMALMKVLTQKRGDE